MEDLLVSRDSDKEDKMASDKALDKMDSDSNKDSDLLNNRIHFNQFPIKTTSSSNNRTTSNPFQSKIASSNKYRLLRSQLSEHQKLQ